MPYAKKILFISWLYFLTAAMCIAQYDTVNLVAAKGENIRLNLKWISGNHGSIQWQKSAGDSVWADVQSASVKYIRFTADSSCLFRARVISGTCNPLYSAVTKVTVLDIKAIEVDSIINNEAVVKFRADFSDIPVSEWGILVSKSAKPEYGTSVKIVTGLRDQAVRIKDLDAGVIYYTRVFAKLGSGQILYSNILSFETLMILATGRIDVTDSSASIWYKLIGDTINPVTGVFYSTSSHPDTTSLSSGGIRDGLLFRADIKSLGSSTTYHIIPWIKQYGIYCFGEPITATTYTDYSSYIADTTAITVRHRIDWKPYATAKQISQPGFYADYGRIRRIRNSDTLILVYHGGPNNQDWINVYERRSFDNGSTWENQKIIADVSRYSNYWRFCNPELLVLKNGWILLAYTANGKPETNENCYIHLVTSKDNGETWSDPLLIQTGRSWEPSMVQLPGGEIEMFYSSESRWWPPVEGQETGQEIHTIHSTNNGNSWSYPKTVAWYPGKRDGMPVPLLLKGNKGVAFAIETVNSNTSPYIVYRPLADDWTLTTSGFENSPFRWFAGYFSGHGGAPYMIQLPGGETVLSVHVYRGGDWHRNNYMQVMIGDGNARNFSTLSTPWGVLPSNESAVNNSLFLKDSTTIVAVSGRNFTDGHGAVYWLEGTIQVIQ